MATQSKVPGKVWASAGAAIIAIVAGVFAVEGGYVNNPDDPGGETNHGVTVASARFLPGDWWRV